MSGSLGVYRYGFDAPARIAGTTEMMLLGAELPPGEPMTYTPISFLPDITTGVLGSGTSGSSDIEVWSNAPSRIDLTFYQGDDVIVPLTITDPSDPTLDLSTGVEWAAQIRVLHTYHSTLVSSFSITDNYTPPDVVTGDSGFTEVTLFLPRSENIYIGRYRWDLYSVTPLDATGFPQPPEVITPEPWPPVDRIRTWLYGMVTILPRVTATDVLDDDLVIDSGGSSEVLISPFFVGPNGRVP